ncbi:universal stress protein [Streptomyces colonosanans]|uniref:Stress-inducible protein n=1 Tax=Streptomyces colonosanans TaxID=1428652 RepID=A0A1S2PLI2_9ACTN|nr:universal stress protein [Streptomyces colonosanans]OIJ94641.1 stress-inducible protein [Streptomyces colonosanans]
MSRTITVGLDGSPESRAAAEWAAREAQLRGLPLKLVQVWEPMPEPVALAQILGAETRQYWTERFPRESAEGLRQRHPGLDVTTEQLTGRPAEALTRAAQDAELLVLGSRGLSGIGGFLVGSVGLAVVASTDHPVVLVRAGAQATDEHKTDAAGIPSTATPFHPVVLGLDIGEPDETLIGFAFDAAARRKAPLRVVHGWNPPPYFAYGMPLDAGTHQSLAQGDATALTRVLRPWREKFPDVEVVEESHFGSPATLLIDASREASLVVVGRRIRRAAIGVHVGPFTHAVLHHATAPVAVVPHD